MRGMLYWRPVLVPLLLLAVWAKAQTPIVDSLRSRVYGQGLPQTKLAALVLLCEQRTALHPDSLLVYAMQAQRLAQNPLIDSVLQKTYLYQCYALMGQGKRDLAVALADKKIAALGSLPHYTELLVRFLTVRSRLYIRQNKHREATDLAFKAISMADELGSPAMQMQGRNAMGLAHMEVGNNREAIQWFLKGISHTPQSDTLPFYEVLCANVSSCYNNIGKYDSALRFAQLAKTLSVQRQNLSTSANILNIEADIFLNLKQPDKAEANLTQALAIRERIGDLNFLLADMGQLALLYAQTGKTDKGISLAKAALALADANKVPSKKIFIYQSLAENYRSAGNFKALSQVQAQLMGIKDSLFEQNSAEDIAALQTQYDLEKSNNIVLTQKIDLQTSRFIVYALLGIMLMAAITGFFIVRDSRRKQRIKLDKAVEEEKRAALKAIQQAEENERIRIAADLHDNLGVYAASLASNLNYIPVESHNQTAAIAMQQLRSNSRAIVDQLNDTIWVLNKESLSLTAISDRTKLFMRNIGRSYPGISFDCEEQIETDHLLPASQAFHLYRLLQEAINNALKHSGGTAIMVRMVAQTHWMVSIADNGVGLSDKGGGTGGGHGMAGMQQRCNAAGWQLNWQAAPGGGTVVTINSTTNSVFALV